MKNKLLSQKWGGETSRIEVWSFNYYKQHAYDWTLQLAATSFQDVTYAFLIWLIGMATE